jgi:hypothetical protein
MTTNFPPTSRYASTPLATLEQPDGTTLVYVRRRFVPPPERFVELQTHTVVEKERLDHIAAAYLGDAEQFWRICDANRARRPRQLTAHVGRRLRITLPEGIPEAPRA